MGLDYFPHDVYASSDAKIEPLMFLYGAKGYAFYFLHLEYIYRNESLDFCISDAETRQILCQKLHITGEEYEKILSSCFKHKLFDEEYYSMSEQRLTSNGIKRRAKPVTDKRESMRQAHENNKDLVSASETTQIAQVSAHKVKESKEKKSKEYNNPGDGGTLFARFWGEYPKRKNKGDALKAWKAIKDDALKEKIIQSLIRQKVNDPQWKKDGGQFIPYPATWLRAMGWEDDVITDADSSRPQFLCDYFKRGSCKRTADYCKTCGSWGESPK